MFWGTTFEYHWNKRLNVIRMMHVITLWLLLYQIQYCVPILLLCCRVYQCDKIIKTLRLIILNVECCNIQRVAPMLTITTSWWPSNINLNYQFEFCYYVITRLRHHTCCCHSICYQHVLQMSSVYWTSNVDYSGFMHVTLKHHEHNILDLIILIPFPKSQQNGSSIVNNIQVMFQCCKQKHLTEY